MQPRRILVAGVGNVLDGDDGFGVELAWRLARRELPAGVKVIETGIGGMSLVQELMQGYDAVLLLDAHQAGGAPGTLRLLEPTLPDLSALDAHQLRDYFADTHYATPLRALALAVRLGLPALAGRDRRLRAGAVGWPAGPARRGGGGIARRRRAHGPGLARSAPALTGGFCDAATRTLSAQSQDQTLSAHDGSRRAGRGR